MTTIKATCPGCGEVSLSPEDITLTEDSYSFVCPRCYEKIWKDADDRVQRLLRSGGVQVVCPVPVPSGPPPLTWSDLLDFHELLQTDGWFDRLTRGVV